VARIDEFFHNPHPAGFHTLRLRLTSDD